MTQKQSDELKDGNLVTVGGTLGRRVQNNGQIQLILVIHHRSCYSIVSGPTTTWVKALRSKA